MLGVNFGIIVIQLLFNLNLTMLPFVWSYDRPFMKWVSPEIIISGVTRIIYALS